MKIELSKPFFVNAVTIIGIGLIGGSLARALKHRNAVGKIIAYDNNEDALKKAKELGVADSVTTNLEDAVKDSDIIIMSTPITVMGQLMKEMMPFLKEDAIVSDVGSTKGSVIRTITDAVGFLPKRFVPAHPIAGTEKHGVENSFPELFENRRTLIIPHINNNHTAVTTLTKMWEAVGSIVEEMGVVHHDQVLAATSHIPHLLAYSTVDTLANLDDRAEIFRFAAGGFRDFTRISTSNPEMWTDICLENREAVLQVLRAYLKKIALIEEALDKEDRDTILEVFSRAKHARDNFYHEP